MNSLRKLFDNQIYIIKLSWEFKKSFFILTLMQAVVNGVVPPISVVLYRSLVESVTQSDWNRSLSFIGIIAAFSLLASLVNAILKRNTEIDKELFKNTLVFNLLAKTADMDNHLQQLPEVTTLKERANNAIQRGSATRSFNSFFSIVSALITIISSSFILSSVSAYVLIFIAIIIFLKIITVSRDRYSQYGAFVEMASVNKEMGYYAQMLTDPAYANEMKMYTISSWVLAKYNSILKRINFVIKRLLDSIFRNEMIRGTLSALEEVVIYIFLVWQVIFESMSIANFTMFLSALKTLSSRTTSMLNALITIGESSVYIDSYRSFISLENTIAVKNYGISISELSSSTPLLRLADVSFSYPGHKKLVLNNVCLDIEQGRFYVIVGENGAGKTTLIRLLCRLYDPQEGMILYSGTDIKEIKYDEYRALFGVVFQDYQYYDLSVAENIAMSEYDGSEEIRSKIRGSLEKVGLLEKVDTLPKGLETRLGRTFEDDGVLLSGGEAQKLALAKALYKDSPILILDEPSSALDAFAEEDLIRTSIKAASGKTVLYISHRLSIARYADEVIFIADGQIVDKAPHSVLLQTNERYSQMYKAQAAHYMDMEDKKDESILSVF